MQHTPARRAALTALAALALAPLVSCGRSTSPDAASPGTAAPTGPSSAAKPYARDFHELERTFDARLGVYALDTGSGREVAHNDGKRFPYASTFKALAAGAMLRKYSGSEMDRVIRYAREDLVANSPVTEKHVGRGMSRRALCDAAVRYSDNAAANLLLDQLDGTRGLQAVLEELGDEVTRMERREPELSRWSPGDTRDTSTARALAGDLREFVLGKALGRKDREQLTKWLRTNTTGDEVIRAGMPEAWVVGDKTGTGSNYGARNDIAVVWPPGRAPLVMAILSHRSDEDATHDDKLIAEAASVVAGAL